MQDSCHHAAWLQYEPPRLWLGNAPESALYQSASGHANKSSHHMYVVLVFDMHEQDDQPSRL